MDVAAAQRGGCRCCCLVVIGVEVVVKATVYGSGVGVLSDSYLRLGFSFFSLFLFG